MSSTTTAPTYLRDKLNSPSLGKGSDANLLAPMGDMLAVILTALMGATGFAFSDTGVSVTSNLGQLSQAPTQNGLFVVIATTGSTIGIKQLVTDPTVTLTTGQVYWDGGINLTFAAVDGVTAFSALYSKSDLTQNISVLTQQVSP